MFTADNTGSLVNHLYSGARGQPEPGNGLGATVLGWTDRRAGTIEQATESSFVWRQDRATVTLGSRYDGSAEYACAPDPTGSTTVFKRVARGNAKGQWRADGRKDGDRIRIGVREEYYDPSF